MWCSSSAARVNTVVRLQLLPAGATPGRTEDCWQLTRDKVTLEAQAAKKEVRTVQRDGRNYARSASSPCPSFYNDMRRQRRGPWREPQHHARRAAPASASSPPRAALDGLVLDLRGDGGGYLPEATASRGLFIDHGPSVQLKDTTGQLEVLDDPDPGHRLRRPAGRAGRSHQRIGLGDIRGRHPGLSPRPDRRADQFRQRHGAERDSARPLVAPSPPRGS